MSKYKMIITDLDGTLLMDDATISPTDYQTLRFLESNNIKRVVATGRNLFSATKVLPQDFPIDFLIYSSGAGIIDWQTQQHLHANFMDKEIVKKIAQQLINHNVDFMIHEIVPDNHKFLYHQTGKKNSDFEKRMSIYKEFAKPLNIKKDKYDHASQLIAILPNHELSLFKGIQLKFEDVKVIRTTSPLDHFSIWMEIFPENVSKGHGVEWLCNYLSYTTDHCITVGNDYNDLDMLELTNKSFVVDNAPNALKNDFQSCKSNMDSGFTDAVGKCLSIK